MWRIKRLTEVFGPCGLGWWYTIKDKRLEGDGEEIRAFVDIDLYYVWDGVTSMPVPGTGGSSFLTKERNGAYTSDECYKMALTDAISVAAKSIGLGADVYFEKDRDKYTQSEDTPKPHDDAPKPGFVCEKCGKAILPYNGTDGKPVSLRAHAERSKNKFGKVLCLECIGNELPKVNEG